MFSGSPAYESPFDGVVLGTVDEVAVGCPAFRLLGVVENVLDNLEGPATRARCTLESIITGFGAEVCRG